MNRFGVLSGLFSYILLILIQVLMLKDIVLYEYAFCFAYVIILLQFPIDTNPIVQLIFAFIIGLSIDLFYNTLGIHAAAATLMIFLKIYWMKLLTPSGGYDAGARINIRTQGLQWFLTYAYPLILIHSITLFFIEAAGVSFFWQTVAKAFYSSLFTITIVLIIQYLFFKKVR